MTDMSDFHNPAVSSISVSTLAASVGYLTMKLNWPLEPYHFALMMTAVSWHKTYATQSALRIAKRGEKLHHKTRKQVIEYVGDVMHETIDEQKIADYAGLIADADRQIVRHLHAVDNSALLPSRRR